MEEKEKIYLEIDKIIATIDNYKNESIFNIEKNRRQNKLVSDFQNDDEILKTFS